MNTQAPTRSTVKTILIVDDNTDIRNSLARLLKAFGCRAATAADGSAALERLRDDPSFDLIILDLMMPVMDGWEFLKRWRIRPANQRSPVLLVSAVGNQHMALDAGAQGYLSKPFDLDSLEAALARVL